MTELEIRETISRPATYFKVGGFKPSDDIKASWIGKVLVKEKGEGWPLHGTWISEGKAASQGIGYPGQDYQAVIMNTPNSWIVRTDKAFK